MGPGGTPQSGPQTTLTYTHVPIHTRSHSGLPVTDSPLGETGLGGQGLGW